MKCPSGIVWPAGKAAVSVVVDYSVPAGAEGIDEAAIAYARTVWGNAVSGGWLIDYLNAYGVKATFAVPLAMARAFPESVRRAHADGHEIAAGSFAKEDVAGLSLDEERERIERTFSGLAELTGTRPEGWFTLPRTGDDYPGGSVSDATGELLLEAGCGYFGNSMADDIPHYWITDYDRRHTLLMLPYYYAVLHVFPRSGQGERARADAGALGKLGRRAGRRAGVGKAVHICDPAVPHAVRGGPGRAGQAHAGGYGCPRSLERHFWSVRGLLEAGLSRGSDAAFREGRVA